MLKDHLKPGQLEDLQSLLDSMTGTNNTGKRGLEKTVNRSHGKTPMQKVQPKPTQPMVTIKKRRHLDKGINDV
jgi:hypothetical protein